MGGLFWDGRADSLEQQAEMPFLNPLEMHNLNKKMVVHGVRKAEYVPLFESLFGTDSLEDEEGAYRHITEAIISPMGPGLSEALDLPWSSSS